MIVRAETHFQIASFVYSVEKLRKNRNQAFPTGCHFAYMIKVLYNDFSSNGQLKTF